MIEIFREFFDKDHDQIVIRSDKKELLKSYEIQILSMFERCEFCQGEVVPSSGMYLCLSGCGHVKGSGNVVKQSIESVKEKTE